MSKPYFSERELGSPPRTDEEISENTWGGIIAAIKSFIADGSFGYRYPSNCPDGKGPYGCDEELFFQALRGDVPEFPNRLFSHEVPSTFVILDTIEFCYRNVAKPIQVEPHLYFNHHHLSFEIDEGQQLFREHINQILSRNGIAYQLEPSGEVIRLLPQVVRESIISTEFRTGDNELNLLLETARHKFFNHAPEVRQEALEKLWDAWERLKTIEIPGRNNKRDSVRTLLDRSANEENFRQILEDEANTLTQIGNNFTIRHWETDKTSLESNEHVDYLFHRLFSLIWLLLRTTKRGG